MNVPCKASLFLSLFSFLSLIRYFLTPNLSLCFLPPYFLLLCYSSVYLLFIIITITGGDTVVKVLCYKSEGRWFDPRLCHWNFSLT